MNDAVKTAATVDRFRPNAWATSWTIAMGGFALCFSVACESTPQAPSERSALPGGGASATSTAPASAPTSSAGPTGAGSASAPRDPCTELRKTVVAEAGQLATCKTDADCVVHPVRLCDFPELDCYAAHVNKASSTTAFDDAVSAYAKSCPLSKCKCEKPDKSVCNSGRCAAK